jgi:molybdenum cofactor cytidylyltransferase
MGTQKLLLSLGDKPMIAVVVDQLDEGPLDEVIVVTGCDGTAMRQALAGRNVRFVNNPGDNDEMLQSVRCGLTAVRGDARGVMVVLGDQPTVTADVVTQLVHVFRKDPRGIVVPTYGGQRGHPLLFAASYGDEILTRYDGQGLRGLLEAHRDEVREVAMKTSAILDDVDTPDDYQRALGATKRCDDRMIDDKKSSLND